MSDQNNEPKEMVGPSGLTQKRLSQLIRIAVSQVEEPLFSQRLMAVRVIERLISKGELMVVRTVRPDRSMSDVGPCPDCGKTLICPEDDFCPGCGAKIIKE